jgi:arylsulfatase A-like enzyme/Tfp pilus assembly protein PilF
MRRTRLATLLLVGAFALVHCGRESSLREPVPVFVISIDTLRSDHLPAYGYRAGSTPNIDAFRRDAVLFSRAFSHTPQTLPSHASIFTGLLPGTTGVRDNVGYVLPSTLPTLAAQLRSNGYQTGGAVSSYVLRKTTGIAAGFDFFDDSLEGGSGEERSGDQSRTALEGWLSGKTGKVFGFLHLYEPHSPYNPPPEMRSGRSLYDGEISQADAIFGRFIETLKQRGMYDGALIVLLSDHGEGLGQHGEDEHGIFVYRESIQVPLLIKLPNRRLAGETRGSMAGLVDVVPTLLAQLGMKAEKTDGIDLLQTTVPERRIYSETYFPRLHLGWSELTSIIDARFHYIAAPRSELYQYVQDPTESKNVLADERRVAAAMKSALQQNLRPLAPPTSVDPEDQRKLAALGYIGSTVGAGSALPDPKDNIESVALFRRGLAAFEHGDDGRAQEILQHLTATNPTFTDAWGVLAQSYRRSGKRAAAIESLKEALRRFPTDSRIALSLAEVLFEAGDHEQARAHAALALHDSPVLAHEALATFALFERDQTTAEREIQAALSEAPDRTTSLLLAASVYERAQNYPRALEMLERALAAFEARHTLPPAGTDARKARALLQVGRVPEAEAAFRSELQRHPDDRGAWGELALIVAAQGRHDAAAAILMQALAMNRDAEMLRVAEESAGVMGDVALQSRLRQQMELSR